MYKLVNENLKSSTMSQTENDGLCMQYKLDEFVYAPSDLLNRGYGLCVFSSLKDIERSCLSGRIFEIEIVGQLPKLPTYHDVCTANAKDIIEYKGERYDNSYWPSGTIMVEAVKLTKEVEWPSNE